MVRRPALRRCRGASHAEFFVVLEREPVEPSSAVDGVGPANKCLQRAGIPVCMDRGCASPVPRGTGSTRGRAAESGSPSTGDPSPLPQCRPPSSHQPRAARLPERRNLRAGQRARAPSVVERDLERPFPEALAKHAPSQVPDPVCAGSPDPLRKRCEPAQWRAITPTASGPTGAGLAGEPTHSAGRKGRPAPCVQPSTRGARSNLCHPRTRVGTTAAA